MRDAPKEKSRPVLVAVITATGLVVVALIGYFGTKPSGDSTVSYIGTVRDRSTKDPIGDARVAITEDQNVPQRFVTDSEGIFHARLSKKTQNMLITVEADGYARFTREGQTIRTGGEEIFLQSLGVPSPDKDTTEILSDYEARLHDLDRLVKQADNSADIDTKGADSILVYRIAYGAAEYRTSLPKFQNVPWATLIRKLQEAGVPDNTVDAIKATDTLMAGPYAGEDSIKRGYFGPGILDAQENALQTYYDAAHKHFFGR